MEDASLKIICILSFKVEDHVILVEFEFVFSENTLRFKLEKC